MTDFGSWLPDLIPYGHDGLTTCTNVYASPLGYKPIRDVSAVTAALPVTWKGGGSFIGLDGTVKTVAGTDSGLYVYGTSSWSLSLAASRSNKWQFTQFGDNIIGVNGGAPVKYTIATGTGAALGGTPPTSTMVTIVRDFVFMAGNPSANSTVYWSAINNAEGWTVGTNQCDIQQLPDGGPVTGMAGGEYGLVFQEAAIHRFSYVGSPTIFQRDKISDGIGCLAPGSVATFGRMTFFLSGRGFYSISDGGIMPIGDQKVNETFWAAYTRSDVLNNIRSTIDPKRSLVIWSMPDCLWIYNWQLDRWTKAAIPGLVGLSTGINAGVSIDALDALYPSGLDSIPYSLDAPIFQGGDPMLTVVKSDNIVYALGGNYLAATLQVPVQELYHGRNTRIRRARLFGDPTTGITLTLSTCGRLGDPLVDTTANTMTTTGYMPIRVTDQFLQWKLDIAAGQTWSFINGLAFDQAPGGSY